MFLLKEFKSNRPEMLTKIANLICVFCAKNSYRSQILKVALLIVAQHVKSITAKHRNSFSSKGHIRRIESRCKVGSLSKDWDCVCTVCIVFSALNVWEICYTGQEHHVTVSGTVLLWNWGVLQNWGRLPHIFFYLCQWFPDRCVYPRGYLVPRDTWKELNFALL